MTFTIYPIETTHKTNSYRQYLKGFPGTPTPASDVKVYKNGKLIRIEDKDGKRLKRIGDEP